MTITKQTAIDAAIAAPLLQNTANTIQKMLNSLPVGVLGDEQVAQITAAMGTIKNAHFKVTKISSDLKGRGKQLKPLIDQTIIGIHRIASELELARCRKKALLEACDITLKRLKNMGFDAAKIEKIEPHPQRELDGYDKQIAALEAEHSAVQGFIESSPVWDTSLLINTRFESESK